MRYPTRYGLAGIGALALLSLVHWARGWELPTSPTTAYLLGVLPNFAAAVAITFALLSIWSDQNSEASFASNKRAFFAAASISGVGLFAWEFFQKTTSGKLVFDEHDLAATLIGLGAASLLFYTITRRFRGEKT